MADEIRVCTMVGGPHDGKTVSVWDTTAEYNFIVAGTPGTPGHPGKLPRDPARDRYVRETGTQRFMFDQRLAEGVKW